MLQPPPVIASTLLSSIHGLAPGQHLCCLYGTEQEHRAVLTPFLQQGLERGEKVLYLADAHAPVTILEYLREAGIPVDACLASGQLSIRTSAETYLQGGQFDPDAMLALLEDESDRALAEGYPRLRLTGEASFALHGQPGSERLMEYETRVHRLLLERSIVAVCQYDRSSFEPTLLMDLFMTHPQVIVGEQVCENMYYLPPEVLQAQDLPSARLDQWIANLTQRRRRDEVQQTVQDQLTVQVEQRALELSQAYACLQQEVSEHRRAEQDLRRSEQRYRAIVEDQSELITRCLPDGTTTFVNGATVRFLCRPAEDILGRAWFELAPPDARGRVTDFFQRAAEILTLASPVLTGESLTVRPSGEPVWISWSNRGLFDEAGRLVEVQIVGHDITALKLAEEELRKAHAGLEARVVERTLKLSQTNERLAGANERLTEINRRLRVEVAERRRAEEALRQSEARLRRLVESGELLVILYDEDGRILEYSGPTSEGWPDELVGRRVTEVLSPDDAEHVLKSIARVSQGGETFNTERQQGWGQQLRWFAEQWYPVRDAGGRALGAGLVAWNITNRKQAEAALSSSEARFRRFYEQAPLGYQSLDRDGRFLDVNRAWLAALGYEKGEVLGRRFSDFMTPESAALLATGFARFLEVGEVHGAEYEMVRKDGSHFIAAFNGKIGTDKRGSFRQTHCIMTDVTERRRSEAQIRASLAEKEVLLREIHHRVKNNLQVMISLLSLQAEAVQDPHTLNLFKESQERIRSMALVHEELYQAHNLAQIDFSQYLRKLTAGLFRAYTVHPGVDLDLQVEPVSLSVDRAIPCGLVVNELLSNALKYAFPGERGERPGRVVVRLEEADGRVLLTVQDDGLGLPSGLDFRRTETLGLQLVNILARQLDGEIDLLPVPTGTAFILSFPAGREKLPSLEQ